MLSIAFDCQEFDNVKMVSIPTPLVVCMLFVLAAANQATSKYVPDVGKSVSINPSAFTTIHNPLLDTRKDLVADQGAAMSTNENSSVPLTGKVPQQEGGAPQQNSNVKLDNATDTTNAASPAANGTNTVDNEKKNNVKLDNVTDAVGPADGTNTLDNDEGDKFDYLFFLLPRLIVFLVIIIILICIPQFWNWIIDKMRQLCRNNICLNS